MVFTFFRRLSSWPAHRFDRRHAAVVGFAVLIVLAVGSISPRDAAAHAAYDRSQPAANAILPTAPPQVHIWFTEPLEAARSGAEVLDQAGAPVSGVTTRVAEGDDYQLVVSLPAGLENGTYTVAWFNVSTADGHPKTGYFAFTVGTVANVTAAVVVEAPDTGAPGWLRALSRWAALLGLTAAVAIWPAWVFVLRPSFAAAPAIGERAAIRAQWLAIAALLAAVAGNVFALLVQAAGTGDGSFLDAVWTTVAETRYGRFWLLRTVLLAAFATGLSWASWWPRPGKDIAGVTALALAAALPFPFSMMSHAAAQVTGRATAIAFDLVHLLGAAVWIGGLYALAGVLLPVLRTVPSVERRTIVASAVPRFSVIALVAWGAMAITGTYSAWLQLGSIDALLDTAYGRSLLTKLALILPLLGLAALNLLVIGPGAKKAVGAPATGSGRWSTRFATAVVAEVVLATVVLLVVGRLIGQEPGHDALARQTPDGFSVPLDLTTRGEARPSTLTVAPGLPGPNDYVVEVGGSELPEGTEAVIRLDLPNVELGGQEIALEPAGTNRFAGSGSELAIAGEWSAEVIVRKLGQLEGRSTVTLPVGGGGGAAGDAPSPAWRFEWPGTVGLLFVIVGLMGLVAAWVIGRSPRRFQAGLFGSSAIFVGAILLVGARIPAAEATLGGRATGVAAVARAATPVTEGDLTVTIEAPDLTVGLNSLVVLVADETGAPVADATVSVEANAVEMDMGVSTVQAAPVEPGRYQAQAVPLGMAGQWEVDVAVERSGREPIRFPFLVEVPL